MSQSNVRATPDNRVDRWKKLWGTPKPLGDDAVSEAFDEFRDNFVPSHMHKWFMKTFGQPKAAFGNRCFVDEAVYRSFDIRMSEFFGSDITHVEATVIYGSPDSLEGWALRGEVRRSMRDLFIDDWHAVCAIVRGGDTTLYAFVELKMKGCVVRSVRREES